MNKRRLLKLADKLETEVPRRNFCMRIFSRFPDSKRTTRRLLSHDCGTAACIAGWAAAFFPRLLRLGTDGTPVLRSDEDASCTDAFASVFGIPSSDAGSMIMGYVEVAINTPKQAVKMIRRYVKTGKVTY